MSAERAISRRRFFTSFFRPRDVAVAATGGLVWTKVVADAKAAGIAYRPPGALPNDAFLATCIRCGQCVEACPFDTLKLADASDPHQAGTPFFEPRKEPCHMCGDAPCIEACPSGALVKGTAIEDADMGVAVLTDQENCLAFLGLRCEVCYRACPVQGDAITLEFREQEPQHGSDRHAFFLPTVHADHCTGCGKCEYVCVIEEPAIRVLPRDIARGQVADHYLLKNRAPAAGLPPAVQDIPVWERNSEAVLEAMGDEPTWDE